MKQILSFLIILTGISARGQSSPDAQLTMRTGISSVHFSNRYFSYLNAYGTTSQIEVDYTREKQKSFFEMGISAKVGELSTDYFHLSPAFLDGKLYINYSKRIVTNYNHTWYVGLGIASELWFFLDNFEDITDLISTIPSHNLQATIRYHHPLNEKSGFQYASKTSILSLVRTQPYASFDEKWVEQIDDLSILVSGELMGPWNFINTVHQLTYYRSLSNKFNLGGTLQLMFGNLDSHRRVSIASGSFLFQLSYKF